MDFFETLPTLYELIITGITLLICTITDIKKREINLWACFGLMIAAAIEPNKDFSMSFVSAALGFIPLFVIARFGQGGDGDALLMGALGFTLPLLYFLYLYFVTSILYAVVLGAIIIIKKENRKKKVLLYAPFVTGAWIIMVILLATGVYGV